MIRDNPLVVWLLLMGLAYGVQWGIARWLG